MRSLTRLSTIFALLIAGSAEASVTYVEEDSVVFSGELGIVTAECPKGTRLTGGGIRTPASYADAVRATQSRPLDGADRGAEPDDVWLGEYFNFSGADPVEITAFAVCLGGPLAADLRYSSKREDALVGFGGAGEADCPGSSRIVGGGIGSPKTNNGTLINSMSPTGGRAPDSWLAFLDNIDGPAKVGFRAYAICAKGKLAERVSFRRSARGVAKGTQDFSDVQCRRLQGRVLGGGFSHVLSHNTAFLNSTYPADGSDEGGQIGDAWISYVDYVNGDEKPLRVSTHTVCLD